jgi:hypothetical protein
MRTSRRNSEPTLVSAWIGTLLPIAFTTLLVMIELHGALPIVPGIAPASNTAHSEPTVEKSIVGNQQLVAARLSLNNGESAATRAYDLAPEYPSLRDYSAMAWDPSAGYVLLFGGSSLSSGSPGSGAPNLDDTWAFSNGSWIELSPSASPPATDFAAMAYDVNASAMVLFGGQIEEAKGPTPVNYTWEFKDGDWANLTNSEAPSPRLGPALAEDPSRGGVILFGGSQDYPYPEVPESDTWSFVNGTWTNITAQVGASPPARLLGGMAFDPNESAVVLFGGWTNLGGSQPLNDTWSLGGVGWNNSTGRSSPPPSGGMGLAYLSNTGAIILYGGSTPALGYDYNQTWSYSAGVWSRLTPASVPPGTFAGTFADDPVEGYGVLLLGAETPNAPPSEQTWVFDQGEWSLPSSNASLPPTGGATMAYDPAEHEVVLVPGSAAGSSTGLTHTWVFANETWTKLNATISPGTLVVYDGADGYLLGFETSFSSTSTWRFENSTWTQLFPTRSPTPGESGGIAYDGRDGYVLFYDCTKGGGNPTTWIWSGGNWINLNLTIQPELDSTLDANTMTYDSYDGYVVLVQRSNLTCGPAGNCLLTWAYSNGTWTDLTGKSAQTPPVLSDISIAYDAAIGKVVLFGGYAFSSNAAATNETWVFSGGQWTELSTVVTPTARGSATMSYDPVIGGVLLFGGYGTTPNAGGGSTPYPLADTWDFGIDNWTEVDPNLTATNLRTDIGVATVLTTTTPTAFGPPTISYSGLPGGCESVDAGSVNCVPSAPGAFVVTASVTYPGGGHSTASTTINVASLPRISEFAASSNPAVVNEVTTLTAAFSGGTAPWTYSYRNLPSWCSSGNVTSVACTPISAGNYSISFTVTDRFGRSDNASLLLVVDAVPVNTSPGGVLPWFEKPLSGLLLGMLIAGVVVLSVVWARRSRMRREGEELIDDVRAAISDGSFSRGKPP